MAWVAAALAAYDWAEQQYRKNKSEYEPLNPAQPTTAGGRPISNMMDMPTMQAEPSKPPDEGYWRPQQREPIQMIQPEPLPVNRPPAQQMPAETPTEPLPTMPPPAMPQGYWQPQPRPRNPWEY